MGIIALPHDENDRLSQMVGYGHLTRNRNPRIDAFAKSTAERFSAAICLVTLVGAGEQWFVGRWGLEQSSTAREHSFCSHTLKTRRPMIVLDALENILFAKNPLVTGPPFIRFYAGAPMINNRGIAIGALCLIDPSPRNNLSDRETSELVELSANALHLLMTEK